MGGAHATVAPTPEDVRDAERTPGRSPPTRSSLPKGVMTKEEKAEERLYESRLAGKKRAFDNRGRNPRIDQEYFTEYQLGEIIPGFSPNAVVYGGLRKDYTERKMEFTMKAYQKDSPAAMENCDREKLLLHCCASPFIVELLCETQTKNRVYLVLNYYKFGSMDRVTLPEKTLKLFAAQITWALEYLHECGIVYRNLKQRNVLIGDDHYVQICNLEESRRVNEQACTFLGLPNISPPEANLCHEYRKSFDWWALGILLYDALFASHPFIEPDSDRDKQVKSVLDKELTFPEKTKFGEKPSAHVKELIEGLLQKKEEIRLGSVVGAVDILWRPWFNDVKDYALYKKEIPIEIDVQPIEPEPIPFTEIYNREEIR